MKAISLIPFWIFTLCCISTVCAQVQVEGIILDAESRQPLEFCHLAVKGQSGGTISNADGAFVISIKSLNDSISISFIGYQSRHVSGHILQATDTLELSPSTISLDELVIIGSDEYLYAAFAKCRNVMRNQLHREAKAYSHTETTVNEKSVEMLECYFNSQTRGAAIQSLDLKRGRAAVPSSSDKFFVSLQNSQALMLLKVTEKSKQYPGNPFQLSKGKMKKKYVLTRLSTLSDSNTLHISFSPLSKTGKSFEGECWIDNRDYSLQKIVLKCDSASVHPFHSFVGSKIEHLKFRIDQSFAQEDDIISLASMRFDYELRLKHSRSQANVENWNVEAKSLLHFYDYDNTFLLPFYNYNSDHDDYRKISFFPYDSIFWSTMHGYVLTDGQKARLKKFYQTGEVMDFRKDFLDESHGFFEHNNIYWSDTLRIKFSKNSSSDSSKTPAFYSDRIGLACQIYLDANQTNGQWRYNSVSIFDIFQSYNYIGETPLRNCFTNIYFDLCEIARRKLMVKLYTGPQTDQTIGKLYDKAVNELEITFERYKREVQQGQNFIKLQEWNDIVISELGVDNIALFKLKG